KYISRTNTMIKNTIKTALSFALIATALFTTNVQAKTNSTTITFKAMIVYPPCNYSFNNNNAQLNCYISEENKVKTSSFNYTKQSPSSEWKKTEDNRSIYQFNWTNKEKGLAMVSVKYL
ncbi:hypothetical protein, partial [Providencia stuartii]|uniref:hypothetical protein n=1 Tax=Providencia stuartii TaxID=588 RepID=UPI002880011C